LLQQQESPAATRRTVDSPEMFDHREVDHVSDGHDNHGRQSSVRNVEEQRREERQGQQHHRSYNSTPRTNRYLRATCRTIDEYSSSIVNGRTKPRATRRKSPKKPYNIN